MNIKTIQLDHGSGGRQANQLINQIILPALAPCCGDERQMALRLHDGAVFDAHKGRMAMTTDSYIIDPIFFPGGSIGDLAVNGTINDLAMCGAMPLYLSVGLILEEGLPLETLRRVLEDMARAASEGNIHIVTGDTKVVPKGVADKMFINTAGIGTVKAGIDIAGQNARPGDQIILSGPIAAHGMAVLTQREGLAFESTIKSDTAPLYPIVAAMLALDQPIHVLRDPTRGGVATILNEIAEQSGVGIQIHEEHIPIADEVKSVCELLGFDPLYVANEGKLIAVVPKEGADEILAVIQKDPRGKKARIIGEVIEENPGRVVMATRIGGQRIVNMLSGEQLPRIC